MNSICHAFYSQMNPNTWPYINSSSRLLSSVPPPNTVFTPDFEEFVDTLVMI